MQNEFNVEFRGDVYPCFYVDTKSRAEQIIAHLIKSKSILAADLETGASPAYRHLPRAALSPHLASPRLLQMFTGTGAVVIDLWRTGPIDLKTLFESRPSCFHNATFDFKMLKKHYNVDTPDIHCTAIMARCVFHALYDTDKSASLKDVSYTLFGEELNKSAGKSDWSKPVLTFEQIQYAAKDAIVQMRVYEKLNEYIDKLGLRKVYDLYRKAQVVISKMELNGLRIDKNKHVENIVKWRSELMDAKDEVLALTGLTSITDAKLASWLEQTLPPKILEVWPRTKEGTGKLSTDANTFVEFSFLDIVKPFSRYQKLKTLTTTFGMNIIHLICPSTGKLHPSYRVAGAKTGRLSCSNPNAQNMPKSEAMRSVFIPDKGYVLVVADYSAVEVRIAAELSNDERMLKIYEDGLDLYRYTAAYITGKKYEDIGKKSPDRQLAKCLVLGLQFMLGVKKFSHYAKKGYDVDVSKEDASKFVKQYRELYPQLRKWQLRQVDSCPVNRYTAFTLDGKSRKLNEDNYYATCVNHPIQGLAASIMQQALIYIGEAIVKPTTTLIATVHDEVVSQCLPEDVEETKILLESNMVKSYSQFLPSGRTLRGLVEPSHGINWADAK